MNISIVIPTDGRRHCLPLVLEALLGQPLAAGDEVVVVDDASAYDVRGEISACLGDARVTLVRHEWSKGLSAARNTGIRAARNDVVLLLDDDAIPTGGWLEGHRAARERHVGRNVAILGRTTLHRDSEGAPFVRYAARTGWRRFASTRVPFEEREVAPAHFWAGNLSADKSFLTEGGGFDELFAGPDCESQELAVRLANGGMRLFYVPGILAEARQPISIRRACKTEFAAGRAFYYFSLKHPDAAARADVPRSAPDGLQTDGAACAAIVKKIEALEARGGDEAESQYPSALALHFVRGFEYSREENEGAQRLVWSGGEWVALRPSKTGSLVRIQSTKGADRENDAILGALRPVPDVLFVGVGNGSHIARHASALPEGRRCFLFEPHDSLYRLFRTRHDPRRVTRIASVEEMSVYWPHRPLQPCILPALKASAAWPYAAVSEMLATRNHLARAPRPGQIRRIIVASPIAGASSPIAAAVKEALEKLGIETLFQDNSCHLAPLAAAASDRGEAANRRLNQLWQEAEEAAVLAVLQAKAELALVFPRGPLSPRALGMLKASGVVSAYWLTEDYASCPEWEGLCRHLDWFFTFQDGPFLEQVRERGVNAHFLPLAESTQEYRDRVLQALSLIGAPQQ